MSFLLKHPFLYSILLPAMQSFLINLTVGSAVIDHTKTYEFAYETRDEEGNFKMHTEIQDHRGHQKGTYGYRNSNGIYRFVDYVADNLGYRVTIRTNEPGISSLSGAHVKVHAKPYHTAAPNIYHSKLRSVSRQIPLIPRQSLAGDSMEKRKLQLQSAVIFPPPPVIRPPRYKPRSIPVTSTNFIEPAFKKSRS